jgi:hypothetical protein
MGGVFINYRTVDNPLAAAAIHESLAGRFGTNRVFRDCVSMTTGTHYPSAIRAALADAKVLVAVIGPQWLTASDPSGERLIDRPHDWVRRELAFAFQQHITVLPVLLKDTPDNATQPRPDELPDDIRALGTIQSCQISQRTLGTDLTRLAERIAPLLTDEQQLTSTPQQALYALVDALEAVPCMRTEDNRSAVLGSLRPAIAGAVRYSPQRRIHILNIVRTCQDYANGLPELIAAITPIEGPDSLPLRRLNDVARQVVREFPDANECGLP